MSWSISLSGDAATVVIELEKIQEAVEIALKDTEVCGADQKVSISLSGNAYETTGTEGKFGMGLNYNFVVEQGCDCEQCGQCGEPDKNLIN